MMWWIWAIIIVLILMILFKVKEVRHKLGLVIVAAVLIFLIFSMTQVYSTNQVDLTSFDGLVYAGKLYVNWLVGIFGNLVKVSNYAVNQEWGLNLTSSST